MYCRKCETQRVEKTRDENGNTVVTVHTVQGRVFVDRIYSERKHIELVCLSCGYRWMLDKTKNVFAAWLVEVERAHANAVTLGPSTA